MIIWEFGLITGELQFYTFLICLFSESSSADLVHFNIGLF